MNTIGNGTDGKRDTKLSWLVTPPGIMSMAVGLIIGLSMGSIELTRSPEVATGVGLAWFIGTAIGLWVGTNSVRLITGILSLAVEDMERRSIENMERAERLFGEKVDKGESSHTVSRRLQKAPMSVCFRAFPILGAVFITFGSVLVIFFATGLAISLTLVLTVISFAVVFVLTSSFAFGYVGWLGWRVRYQRKRIDLLGYYNDTLNRIGHE